MTCHVLHAGDGYTYLTQQVASGDVTRTTSDPLVNHYQAEGNKPGHWAGAGRADLGMDGTVTEDQMLALFGEGLRPDANEFIEARIDEGASYTDALREARLGRKFAQYDEAVPVLQDIKAAYKAFELINGRRASVEERREIKEDTARGHLLALRPNGPQPNRETVRKFLIDQLGKARQPVAGFDLVFSPVKSVSLLWALGGHNIRLAVEEIHEAAWRGALAYGEREAAFTRTGAGGVAQVATSGFVAATFEHRDSRAGDPDLHTHVAISNRVLTKDGKWLTIDGQQLFKVAVSMSEVYNSLVEQGLVDRFGVNFVEVKMGGGKRSVREIAGMPQEWIRGFSRRRTQVEAGYDVLVRDYVRTHGHTPPRTVQMKLAQQATLADRPVKTELKTLAQQVADWVARAHVLRPGLDVDDGIREVIRSCLYLAPSGPVAANLVPAKVATRVIDLVSTDRSSWTVYHVRAEAQRQLRPTIFPHADARHRAVEAVVEAALGTDSVLLDLQIDDTPKLLQREPDGESVFLRRGSQRYTSEEILAAEDRLIEAAETDHGPVVSRRDRNTAIARFTKATHKTLNPGQRALLEHFTSSGKALAVAIGPPGTGKSTAMAAVREAWETTGGRVIGLAPSAAAASVLGDELGVRADTLHSLTTAYDNGDDVGIAPGDMLLVDEAGMAGTRILDQIRGIADTFGAVVRLIGDHRQLPSIEAGGALRLIYNDAGGVELTEVRRFTDPAEAEAVLQFRVGDTRALAFYADNHRLVGGSRPAVLDRLYLDWQNDRAAGFTAIMISDSADIARELSSRAQTERRAAGKVELVGVALHDDNVAGVGDVVVTRRNKRRLAVLGGKDYVKNGDLWDVEQRLPNGAIRVRHQRHGGAATLPAWYVEQYVELGYAATINRSQGLNVEKSRSFLTAAATRALALVGLSRGTEGNHAYLDTEQLLDTDEPHLLPGDLFYRNRETTDAMAALAAIMANEGVELSGTEELRDALDAPYRMTNAVPQFGHALMIHRGPAATVQAREWVLASLPDLAEDILADEAWPALQQVLHEAHDAGADPAELLSRRAVQRELDTAKSVAKVLHYRVTEAMPTRPPDPARPELLPGWVPSPPADTAFSVRTELPEFEREGMDPTPLAQWVWGGGDPAQLCLFSPTGATGVDGATMPVDADQVALFGASRANAAQAHLSPGEHIVVGGPDPEQLMLFPAAHFERKPDDTTPDVDSEQLALFSADAPTHQVDLMELGEWLTNRADLIADRVQVLGERAIEAQHTWTGPLGGVPDDPLIRNQWIANAGHVAAYRERWKIPDDVEDMLPPHARGEQGRARTWVENYLVRQPMPQAAPPTSSAQSTPKRPLASRITRVREKLAAMRDLLADAAPLSPGSPGLSTATVDPPDELVAADLEQAPAEELDAELGPELEL